MARRRIIAGRYELLAEVGSGGMGTVYRARDRRTGTIVAVKLLHSHLAQDRHYVERFRREAQIAKSLDSVYIVRVLDVGDHDEQPFIVMEYVPGSTLREVLEARRRFSPQPALALCLQIVEALREAHRKGVVHRDIKPQNIILTSEGAVKVADFGVAKAEELSTLTLSGSFFGTLQYAAPERFEGEGDSRSDIYSVGIILYQMLTGAVPFAADSALALIRLHSEQPPAPLSQHIPDVSRDVQALVSCCLAKSPAERFQSPDALANAISSLLPAADAKAALARIPLPKRRGGLRLAVSRRWMGHRRLARTALGAGAAAIIIAGASLGAVWALRGTGTEAPPPMPSPTPSGVVVGETEGCLASAERIAYVGEDGDVWFVDSDGTSATPVTESGSNGAPVFSPDGKKLAYSHGMPPTAAGVEGVEIRFVSFGDSGFTENTIADPEEWFVFGTPRLEESCDLRWNPSGDSILAQVYLGKYIRAYPLSEEGTPYDLGAGTGALTYEYDVSSVNGDVVYVSYSNQAPTGDLLHATDAYGSNPRDILAPDDLGPFGKSYGRPAWSPVSEDIAFYFGREGVSGLAIVGSDASSLREVATMGWGTDRPRWSPDGKQIAFDDGSAVWVVDAAGATEPRKLADGTHPTWSPDGTQIAYESGGSIWVVSAEGGEPRLVASGSDPEWSLDASVCEAEAPATQIAYVAEHGEIGERVYEIYLADAGTGRVRLLAKNVHAPYNLRWAPDGQEIAFCSPGAPGGLWVIHSDATDARRIGGCGTLAWSPDGTKIAFSAPEHMAVSDVFVVNPDGTGGENLTNSMADYNVAPDWSPDSKQILFAKQLLEEGLSGTPDLYLINDDGTGLARLTNDPLLESHPHLSPDGSTLVYEARPVEVTEGARHEGTPGLYQMDMDTRETQMLRDMALSPQWSLDGSKVAYVYLPEGHSLSVAELRVTDMITAVDVRIATGLDALHCEYFGCYDWSPDGSQLAFVLDQNGESDVFVANADGSDRRQITTDGLKKYSVAWGPPSAAKSLATAEPLDLTPPGYGGQTATPTPTTPVPDARSVPIESLIRSGAEVQKVLYASLDATLPEEIVVYSDMTVTQGETECGPVPFLEIFAYDPDAGQWAKVFDASEGEEALIGRLEEYQEGPMCFGEWIHPLELTDFDSDARHELLVRTLAGGGTANFTAVTVLGFEGEAPEFTATKLFQAYLTKLQAVVLASEAELWLEQGLWLRDAGAQMGAMLRGVVRYDATSGTIAVVDEQAQLLCTEGTVLDKAPDTLTVRCEAYEPGVEESFPPEFEATESFPVDMEFIVDQYTQFDPKPSVSSLDDVQIGEFVRVWPATLGLQAVAGATWGWRLKDGVWSAEGAWVSPVAGLVEVVSAP